MTSHHLFARFGWCHKLPFSKPPPNPTIDVMDATAARDGQKTFKVKQRERTAMGQEELQSSNHLAKWWCFIISPTLISLKTLGDFSKAQLLFSGFFGRVRSWWTLTSEVIFIKTCFWTSHCDYGVWVLFFTFPETARCKTPENQRLEDDLKAFLLAWPIIWQTIHTLKPTVCPWK